jgi:hypothetical protein
MDLLDIDHNFLHQNYLHNQQYRHIFMVKTKTLFFIKIKSTNNTGGNLLVVHICVLVDNKDDYFFDILLHYNLIHRNYPNNSKFHLERKKKILEIKSVNLFSLSYHIFVPLVDNMIFYLDIYHNQLDNHKIVYHMN